MTERHEADTDSTDVTDCGNDKGGGKGIWLLFSLEEVPDAFSGETPPAARNHAEHERRGLPAADYADDADWNKAETQNAKRKMMNDKRRETR